jgi:hypothetical protein
VCAVVASSCGPSADAPIAFEAKATIDHRNVAVQGVTDLIDGSSVTCSIWHESEAGASGTGSFVESDTAIVAAGRFECSFNLASWPSGKAIVDIEFAPYFQPDTVKQRYGPYGERLGGDKVVPDSDGHILEVKTSVEILG